MDRSALADASLSTSLTLLERVKKCDAEAWRRFVQLYGPTIFGWGRRASLQAHDAADVTQEVFQAVAVSIQRFRRDRPSDTFRGWLRVITNNKIRDLQRRRPVDKVGTLEAEDRLAQIPADDSSAEPIAQEKIDLAHRAMELIQTEFAPTTWKAFLQCTVAGRTVGETAVELGMTVAAVYKAKSRVLIRLRRELEGLLD